MEAKYGRLFTADDVTKIVDEMACAIRIPQNNAAERAARVVRELDAKGSLTFPADEPLFLLRGKDLAATDAIHEEGMVDPTKGCCYSESCLRLGAGVEHIAAVIEAAREFKEWQERHPERCNVPD